MRYSAFRKVLFTEVRDSDLKVKLMLFLTPALAISVMLLFIVGRLSRIVSPTSCWKGSFLLGLLGGRAVGPLGGSIVSLPAFFNHEWLSTPVAASLGLAGGLIRQAIPNREDIWNFGPFTFLGVPRALSRFVGGRIVPWEMLPLGRVALLESAGWPWATPKPHWLLLSRWTRATGGRSAGSDLGP